MSYLRALTRRSVLLIMTGVFVAASCGTLPGVRASELRRTPIVQAIELARPAIVNIHGEKVVTPGPAVEGVAQDTNRRVNGMGTGIVVDERGYIVTNFHVIDGVRRISVTTSEGETYTARTVERDPKTDLAIIKIDPQEPFPTIVVGTSDDLMPGETVLAVGNAYGYEHTVTQGIISALRRTVQVSDVQTYENLIQTDASINPGNSGGPLLNIDGEMIGINVAVRAGAQGIGFAIPVDEAMAVVAEMLSKRRLEATWAGFAMERTSHPSATGVVVASIDDEGPAATSGLEAGDVIVAIEGIKIDRPLDVERALIERAAGDRLGLEVDRGNRIVELTLTVGRPRSGGASKVASADPYWEALGLRLEKVPTRQFQQLRSRYRGGLLVTDVRSGSAAAAQGIQRGDILVGMHVWETVTLDNVAYILSRPDFSQFSPLKFYILRGSETLYGDLMVSHRQAK